MKRRVLVIAPHPDDEVLGVGGTMARLAAEGSEIYVLIVTKGTPPMFDEEYFNQVRREALAAHKLLGVKETRFLSLPAAHLDTIPHAEVNAQISQVCAELEPDVIFVPFLGDIHNDHQLVFLSTMVAARPNQAFSPRTIYAYETLSETNWGAPYLTPSFSPNVYIDITETIKVKLDAISLYDSQLRNFPHERSIETLKALALLRGSTVGCHAAEAFVLVRDIS
jgi:N-acetylglucosamine malate deacetylase 1